MEAGHVDEARRVSCQGGLRQAKGAGCATASRSQPERSSISRTDRNLSFIVTRSQGFHKTQNTNPHRSWGLAWVTYGWEAKRVGSFVWFYEVGRVAAKLKREREDNLKT